MYKGITKMRSIFSIFQTHPYFADTGGSTPLDVAKNREIIRLLKKAQNEEVESMVKVSSEQN